MNIVKDEAKKMIDRLPDNATCDDIMYELYVKKKIAAGLTAAEEGRVVSHEDAKKRLLSILSRGILLESPVSFMLTSLKKKNPFRRNRLRNALRSY